MKVLQMNIYFELPEDFKGDYNDAILEYVKYRQDNNKPKIPEVNTTLNFTNNDEHWDLFLKIIKEGKKCVGTFFVGELIDNEWVEFE